jgi:membrane-bound lytic murein transglycosylase A
MSLIGPGLELAGATMIVGLTIISGCVTARPKPAVIAVPVLPVTRYTALVRLDPPDIPKFTDDMDAASLQAAALQSLAYFKTLPAGELFVIGKDTCTATDLAESMAAMAGLLENPSRDWPARLGRSFVVYQSVGIDPERTVVFSSYYEPTISARLTKDSTYRYPLYARPPDLIDVDLGLFDPAYQGARLAGRREGKNLVPYPTRSDIDSGNELKGQRLELAWAKDPADVLDLQIEGSGWLDFGNGDVRRIRYDGTNGRKYRSVGQYLIASGKIPARTFSRAAFLRYLASHPKERQSFLNVNERYVFFRIDTSMASAYAYGNIEAPLTPGRSIATDPKLFPRGALAWIDVGMMKRFMVNQDEGGAIQGPGRVDIFAGHGTEAARFASHLWDKGSLYFLVLKKPSR